MKDPRTKGSITVGTVVGAAAGLPQVHVDGITVDAPNLTGIALVEGQPVTLERLGGGRYQLVADSGYWAPRP